MGAIITMVDGSRYNSTVNFKALVRNINNINTTKFEFIDKEYTEAINKDLILKIEDTGDIENE